jgi:protein-tyrosine-phosphatase
MLRFLGQWLFEFRHLLLGREHHDGIVPDDAKPGREELMHSLRWTLSALRRKLLGTPAPVPRGLTERLVTDLAIVDKPVRILFVCEGNICRSPYAERRLLELFAGHDDRFEVASAGMLPRNARASPPAAIAAANRRGIDLSTHRSRHAFEESMKEASQVLIFDRVNLKSVLARYPQYAGKVFLLGELSRQRGHVREIDDPFGKAAEDFDSTYGQIDQCLEVYAALSLAIINKEEKQTCSIQLPAPRRAYP